MISRVVLIPVFNEAKTIKESIELLSSFFKELDPELRIYCIDDGSSDDSFEIIEGLHLDNLKAFKLHQNLGYGGAVRFGVQVAKAHGAQKVVIMDSDLTNPPNEVIKMFNELQQHDFVKASRFLPESDMSAVPMKRRIYSIVGNRILRLLFRTEIKDVTNGFRGWIVDEYLRLPKTSNGFHSIVEEFYWSKKYSTKATEIPSILGIRDPHQRKTSASYSLGAIWGYFRPGLYYFMAKLFGANLSSTFEKRLLKNDD